MSKQSVIYIRSSDILGEDFRIKQLTANGFSVLDYLPNRDDYDTIDDFILDDMHSSDLIIVMGMKESKMEILNISRTYGFFTVIIHDQEKPKLEHGNAIGFDNTKDPITIINASRVEFVDGDVTRFSDYDFDIVMGIIKSVNTTKIKDI